MPVTELPAAPTAADPDVIKALASELEGPLTEALSNIVRDHLATVLARPSRPEPLLTVGEVADRLAVSKRTVETMIAEGELKPVRVRGARRFERTAIDAYVRDRTD